MLARLIATVAALLLACASPQASAYVRAESLTTYPGHSASELKTALPARANAENLEPGENQALTHCHVWENGSQSEKSASATALWHWDSAPFGDTAANEHPTAGMPNFTFNLRFPGQQYDRETGTHYNYFRDYEAGTGRYGQSDPIGLWGGIATYSYARNSATGISDRFGLKGKGGNKATKEKKKCETGCFDVLDRTDYPEDIVPFPEGPVELISDDLYQERLKKKNNENRKLHLTDPAAAGKDILEIKPVRFGGSPTDKNNKIYLDPEDHKKCTRFWNKLQNDVKKQIN